MGDIQSVRHMLAKEQAEAAGGLTLAGLSGFGDDGGAAAVGGGVTARGEYQKALIRARHRKMNPKSPRAPPPLVAVFIVVEKSFAELKKGVQTAYVLLESMPLEALTQLQVRQFCINGLT